MTRSRVPTTRKAIEACLRELVRQRANFPVSDMPEELLSALEKKNSTLARQVVAGTAQLADLLDDGFIHSAIDPHQSIQFLPKYVQSFAATVGRFRYRSFLHNATETGFISSDNPVVIYRKTSSSLPIPYPWMASENFCAYFPITPNICFYYDSSERDQPYHRRIRSNKTVKKLNEIVCLFADRFLVARDKSDLDGLTSDMSLSPVPDLSNSSLEPGRLTKLSFQFGSPVSLEPWKYDFESEE